MRVVGLVSGGKDSCYNLLQCIAAGHQIVALANLEPRHGDEIDSYMYQSVGHMGMDLFAEAIGLPLIRRKIQGKSINIGDVNYLPTEGDEVEDLYWLLKQVKEEYNVEGVGVGAVLSEYQRVRVENVCERLGLVSLAYMWRRDQSELLQEMVDCGLEAIVIKVATYGLTPEKHLGKTIKEMQPYLEKMKDKYHMNVCGEGGEYETFTLDCPIFRKKIVLKDADQVLSSGDVGYLNFREMELLDKEIPEDASHLDLVQQTGIRSPYDFLVDLNLAAEEQQAEEQAKQLYEERKAVETCSTDEISNGMKENTNLLANGELNVDATVPQVMEFASRVPPSSRSISTMSGFVWCGSHSGQQMDDVMAQIKETLAANGMEARHVVSVRMLIKNMHNYSNLNADYIKHFSSNPPVRVCVEAPLPPDVQVQIDLTSWKQSRFIAVDQDTVHVPNRTTMHVQGISHWAPANIGPYSQGVKIGNVILLAGMIGLVPGTMELVTGGVEMEARLSLRHVSRVIAALSPGSDIRCVVQGVCFLANLRDVGLARRMMARVSESQISTYVVVPKLPRGALIEWQTWAFVGNQRFDYEERGYTSGNVSVRMRRRWSHDNTVCAIITNASAERGVDMSVEILEELIRYTLRKAPAVDHTIPANEDKDLFIEKQSTAVCLTAYYKVGELPLKQLQKALDAALPKDSAAVSYVPVLAIEDKSVLLSLTAIRH